MENINERYLYFLLESSKPVYVKEPWVLDIVRKYPHFEINNQNQETFVDDLSSFMHNNGNVKKAFVIIDTTEMNDDMQKRISCLVKDNAYQTLKIFDNCKIIATGKSNNINKDLLGLLVLVDV